MPSLTVLLTAKIFSATKTFYRTAEGSISSIPYNSGSRFKVEQHDISNLKELSSLLTTLEADHRRFIIRGIPHEATNLNQPVRRRLVRDTETNRNESPFIDSPQSWVMIDIDHIPTPEGTDLINNPEAAVQYAISQLPEEFHHSSCHWQLSSSSGTKDSSELSVHLWFWLETPVSNYDLKEWSKKANQLTGQKLIDPALYNPVQPHYTAAPIFSEGVEDPLKQRSGLINKENDSVEINLNIELSESTQTPTSYTPSGFQSNVHGFENILDTLGDHQGGEGFNEPLLRAAASYVATKGGRYAEEHIEELKEYLRDCIEGAEKSATRPRSDIDRYMSDQYLDEQIKGAIEKFGDKASPDVPPYFDTQPLPFDEADQKLQKIIYQFTVATFEYLQRKKHEIDTDPSTWVINPPPTLGIKAAAGIGKTTRMILDSIKTGAFSSASNIEFYVPSHTLSDELKDTLREHLDEDLSSFGADDFTGIRVIKGRDKADEDGVELCHKYQEAKQVSQLGLSVQKTLCDDEDGNQCEYLDTCGYQKQFHPELPPLEVFDYVDLEPPVTIMAHNHLFLHTRDNLPRPDMVIVDENFYKVGYEEISFPLRDLRRARTEITKTIYDLLSDNEPLLKGLRLHGITPTVLTDQATELYREITAININPSMSQQQQARSLGNASGSTKVVRLLQMLADELNLVDRDHSHCVRFIDDKDLVTLHQRKSLTIPEDIPMIFIDADLNPSILHQFKPDVPVVKIPVERQAEVIQFKDLTFSKNALLKDNESLLNQARDFIESIGDTGKTLVATSKSIRKALTGEKQPSLPKVGNLGNASIVHFSTLRGLNAFKDYDNVILLGREQPSPAALEGVAAGLWWDDVKEIQFLSENESGSVSLIQEKRGYRMHDDESPQSVQTQVHPDHRVQMHLEQIREAESTQAIDRLRLVRPTKDNRKRKVYILSCVPLDITVDHAAEWKQLQRAKDVWESCNGIMPMAPDHLILVSPIIRSTGTARRFSREMKKLNSLINIFIKDLSTFKHQYRTNKVKWSDIYISPDISETKQALEEQIDEMVELAD